MTVCTGASFDPCLLRVLSISKICAYSLFEGSCMYVAPTLWNTLEFNIKLLDFDAQLKTQDTSLSEVLFKLNIIEY